MTWEGFWTEGWSERRKALAEERRRIERAFLTCSSPEEWRELERRLAELDEEVKELRAEGGDVLYSSS